LDSVFIDDFFGLLIFNLNIKVQKPFYLESMTIIKVDNLSFSYPNKKPVLQDITLTINSGECIALLGRTGSGKSTLFENLIGLKKPQAGSVLINGLTLEPSNYKQIQAQIGYCFQDPNDQLFMPTILEDITFGPLNLGVPKEVATGKALDLLTEFGLEESQDLSVHELSGGQKRLVALASILSMNPSILFLDEPTNGLDPFWRRKLGNILSKLFSHTILIASHDFPWLARVTRRSILLSDGKIEVDRDTKKLFEESDTLEAYGLPQDW
jgi:cobalt/nickel transport system ATP-binding protein